MATENETIADIIAEKRALADRLEHEMAVAKECKEPTAHRTAQTIIDSTRREADRLEAALKRERGDCAKLREVLCEILSYIESFHKYIIPGKREKTTAIFAVADTIRGKGGAGLAAPPRNCDVGTVKEQSARFDKFCDAHKYVGDDGANWCSRDCPCYNYINCGVQWAQMPYEEGGAK